jgi:hypothetical protein
VVGTSRPFFLSFEMAKRLGRIRPESFQQLVHCTDGERRLVTASPLSDFRRSDARLDGDRGRLVLQGIRRARAEASAPRKPRAWS